MNRTNCIVVLMLVLACSMPSVWSQDPTTEGDMDPTETTEITTTNDQETTTQEYIFTTCAEHPGSPFDLESMKGYWYETAVTKGVDNMQCTNFSLPANANAENKIELRVEYVDTTDDKWESAQKSGSFPWDEQTQNGIFNWQIGEEPRVPVTYKLISSDGTRYALFCGYTDSAPLQTFRVWTRQRHLSSEEKTDVLHDFESVGLGSDLVWVEQSLETCNSAMRSAGGALVALALALLIYRRDI